MTRANGSIRIAATVSATMIVAADVSAIAIG
jgi:hypothetical protein